jgi:hypothetical protein
MHLFASHRMLLHLPHCSRRTPALHVHLVWLCATPTAASPPGVRETVAVQYSTVRRATEHNGMAQYSTVQYGTVRYGTVQYSTVQYSTVQYSTVQYSTVQYSTVQYSTVQCSTVQYSTGHDMTPGSIVSRTPKGNDAAPALSAGGQPLEASNHRGSVPCPKLSHLKNERLSPIADLPGCTATYMTINNAGHHASPSIPSAATGLPGGHFLLHMTSLCTM